MKYNEFIKYFRIEKKNSETSCMAICPCHNDKKASLSISNEGDKILIHCFAGCRTDDILKTVGLHEKDLFNNVKKNPRVVAEYIYQDEDGKPLYKVMRFEPKDFIQAKYDNRKMDI